MLCAVGLMVSDMPAPALVAHLIFLSKKFTNISQVNSAFHPTRDNKSLEAHQSLSIIMMTTVFAIFIDLYVCHIQVVRSGAMGNGNVGHDAVSRTFQRGGVEICHRRWQNAKTRRLSRQNVGFCLNYHLHTITAHSGGYKVEI